MRSLRELNGLFPNAKETGLRPEQVASSLQSNGVNKLTPLPREPLWKKFLGKFDEAIIKILLAATLLKTVVDLFETPGPMGFIGLGIVIAVFVISFALKLKSWLPAMMFGTSIVLVVVSLFTDHPSFEGLAVMVAVVLATGVAFASEYKSDKEFEVLNSQKDSLQTKVLRDGHVVAIPMDQVVVGDLVVLEMGDEIPADGRVVKATDLLIDQSLMTGESEPVKKAARGEDETVEGPDQPSCLYRGTQVVDGSGQMLIAAVGDATMIGQIAKNLSADAGDEHEEAAGAAESQEQRIQKKLTISKEETPLQQKLNDLAGLISKIGYIAAIAIFVALLIRGYAFTGEVRFSPKIVDGMAIETQGEALRATLSAVISYFVYMVIIIVVAVPEGLPMSVTVSLALAMRKMTRANSLVRQLVACETIGSATVICSDKTGTLTQNKMMVDRLGAEGEIFDRTGNWPKPGPGRTTSIDWIALNGNVNSTANLDEKEGKTIVIGNSTEGALIQWTREAGLGYEAIRKQHELLYQMHFTSDRKRMTSVVTVPGNQLVSLVKGAPEIVLELCQFHRNPQGQVVPLTAADRERILQQISEAAHKAMRTLAFAHKDLPSDLPRDDDGMHAKKETFETDLIFDGFVGIRDPLRPDVKASIEECRAAGIEVKMITGDNIETARAIGQEIGLMDAPGSIAMTSAEFNQLTDEQLKEKLPFLRIVARARPLDKYRLVRLLQEQEHVVAVTGDGTNDAPALKKADVGLAMGIAGTEVAKEASKIVLLDDSFSTIVKAVHWGRSLYENIQRFIQFQLTINVSALLIAFLGPFFGVKPPFTVLQLLWINVIMDTFASIALCSEPPRAGLMRNKPKRRSESIVSKSMLTTILTTASFFVVVMMALLLMMENGWFAQGSGENPKSWDFDPLNVRQVSIFFTVYVMFQVWNQINCRTLTPEVSGLKGVLKNRAFMAIMLLIVIGQVLIVTLGGAIFSVEPLRLIDWIYITAATSSVIVFSEIVRLIRKAKIKVA